MNNGGNTVASDGQTVVKYKVAALTGTPPRMWSDALSVPYSNTDPQKMLGETQAAICQDPLYGVTVANFFATMSVGNVHLVDLNDWLKPFGGDAKQINVKAAEYIPLLDVQNPSVAQQETAVAQNIAWQKVAEKIGTLLSRFHLAGVRSEQSVKNYHLVAGGAVVGGLPEVGLNPSQENLPALMLELTEKGACAPLKVIGFNTGDKRSEEFTPRTCVKPQPKAPAPKPKPRRPQHHRVTTTTTTRPRSTTTTTRPSTTTTTVSTTTTTVQCCAPPCTSGCSSCPSGKCTPPTTTAPPPTTAPPTTSTSQPQNGGQGGSGAGATNTTSPPTTTAPSQSPPTTSSPTTAPPPPPAG